MNMQAITPYLNFNGTAEQALELYAQAFEGTVLQQQKFKDMPGNTNTDWQDKILHAVFTAGDLTIMVSDIPSPDEMVTSGSNTSLSLNFDNVTQMEKVFNTLSNRGTITMPLQDTFWGARFGMLTDRFGINWMFNHDYENK